MAARVIPHGSDRLDGLDRGGAGGSDVGLASFDSSRLMSMALLPGRVVHFRSFHEGGNE